MVTLVSLVDATISTHALREEGDRRRKCKPCSGKYFYPRPPRGGRLSPSSMDSDALTFLPTPSARRATYNMATQAAATQFLPTPSARRATTTA